MDFITNLGELALGSRLRRLSDRVMSDGIDIYAFSQLDFQPRWFPIYRFLAEHDRVTLAHIARELGITHPSVHQTLAEMTRAKLVTSVKCTQDKRKRLISLSKHGKALLPQIRPVWDDIRAAIREVIEEANVDVLHMIERMEAALDRDRFADRFRRYHTGSRLRQVEIIDYDPRYRAAFEALNRQWIEFYFKMEAEDERTFADPETYILAEGGRIFFARERDTDTILGTVALIKRHGNRYELAKMAVSPEARGRSIGRKLGEAVLACARDMGLSDIMLLTNSKLVPAINLYKRLGFVSAPDEDMSDYERADTCMIYHFHTEPAAGAAPSTIAEAS